jgi:hypothetical protein
MAQEDAKRDQNRIVTILAVTDDGNIEPRRVLVDPTTGRLKVNTTVTGNLTVDNLGTAIITGQKVVEVTSTAIVVVASETLVKNGVIVQALAGNSTTVVVGGSTVTTANGYQLQAGQATSIAIDDLHKLYVNGTAGDGVCFISSV